MRVPKSTCDHAIYSAFNLLLSHSPTRAAISSEISCCTKSVSTPRIHTYARTMADPHPSSSSPTHTTKPINTFAIASSSSPPNTEPSSRSSDEKLQLQEQQEPPPRASHADFKTPYAAVARARLTCHLTGSSEIGRRITSNRHDFENFLTELSGKAAALGVPDGPEITRAVHLIEQAKDIWGRALIHDIGTCNKVPFEQAVRNATLPVPGVPIEYTETAKD